MIRKTVMSVLVTGCASIHSGNIAETVDGKSSALSNIVVSAREINSLSSQYFANFDFTIENKTSEFIKIKNAYLDFGDLRINANLKIPQGLELKAWADAASQNKDISDYNTSLILASISVMGLTMAMTGDSQMLAAGVGAAAVSTTIDSYNILTTTRDNLEMAPRYPAGTPQPIHLPASHLYAGAFQVPPGLHIKKWVTVYTPVPLGIPKITMVKLILNLEDGTQKILKINMRSESHSSNFQPTKV